MNGRRQQRSQPRSSKEETDGTPYFHLNNHVVKYCLMRNVVLHPNANNTTQPILGAYVNTVG